MSENGTIEVMTTETPTAEIELRALVVDDEVSLAEVVASYLRRELFEVHLAHDGRRALDVAREVDPDVVVLDVGLPGADGIEVCRQLRTFSDAYVVMLTARDTELDTVVGLSGSRSAPTTMSLSRLVRANWWPAYARCCVGPATHLTRPHDPMKRFLRHVDSAL